VSEHSTAEGGGGTSSIGFELKYNVSKGFKGGVAMNSRKHLVLEIGVLDTGNSRE